MAKSIFQISPLDAEIERQRSAIPPVDLSPPDLPDISPLDPLPMPANPASERGAGAGGQAVKAPPQLKAKFEQAALRYDVPINVLMALGEQESRYNPIAVGTPTQWGRAKGIMQYLDSTAQRLGINPFDPGQSIDAAARQLRERLNKGYSMADAVKEHFAGPDRKQWGKKTARYGVEVLGRAARLKAELQPEYGAWYNPGATVDDRPAARPSAGAIAQAIGADARPRPTPSLADTLPNPRTATAITASYESEKQRLPGEGGLNEIATPEASEEYRAARRSQPIEADDELERAGVKFWQRIRGLGAGGGRAVEATLTDLGLDPQSDVAQWLRAKAQSGEDYSQRPVTGEQTWEALKAKPTISGLARFVIEQGGSSLADMGAIVSSLPAYVGLQAGSLGQQRAENDGGITSDADSADVLKALPASVLSAWLDRLGIHGIFGANARTVVGRVAQAFGTEALTEALQSPVEYAGSNLGTEKGFDPMEALDQAIAGAVAGGPMGGAIRGGGEIINAVSGKADTPAAVPASEAILPVDEPAMQAEPVATAPATPDLGTPEPTPPIAPAPAGPMGRAMARAPASVAIPPAVDQNTALKPMTLVTEGNEYPVQMLGETADAVWVKTEGGIELQIPHADIAGGKAQLVDPATVKPDLTAETTEEAPLPTSATTAASPEANLKESVTSSPEESLANSAEDLREGLQGIVSGIGDGLIDMYHQRANAGETKDASGTISAPLQVAKKIRERRAGAQIARDELEQIVRAVDAVTTTGQERQASLRAIVDQFAPEAIDPETGEVLPVGGAPAPEAMPKQAPALTAGAGVEGKSEEQLRERLKYLSSQARTNAGWTKPMIAEKKAISAAIDAMKPAPAAPAGDIVAEAAAQAATSPLNSIAEPTEAQKEAGNYAKGHVVISGLDVSIENPAGTSRRPEWPPLKHSYGYVKRSEGADGDHVDVFLGPKAADPTNPVFIVDQVNKDGSFDEHKVMVGFADKGAARRGYLANYEKGWTGFADITEMPFEAFKQWVKDPGRTLAPAGTKLAGVAKLTPALDLATTNDVTSREKEPTVVTPVKELAPPVDQSPPPASSPAAAPSPTAPLGQPVPQRPTDKKNPNPYVRKGEKYRFTERVAYLGGDQASNIYTVETAGKKEAHFVNDVGGAGSSLPNWQLQQALRSGVLQPVEAASPPAAITPVASDGPAKAAPASISATATVVKKTDAPPFAGNKLFTADKVEAARARLREKMGRINSGVDPEVLVDGMTPIDGRQAIETDSGLKDASLADAVAAVASNGPAKVGSDNEPPRSRSLRKSNDRLVTANVGQDAAPDDGIGPASILTFLPATGPAGISVVRDGADYATAVFRDKDGTARGGARVALSDEARSQVDEISTYVAPDFRRQGIGTQLYAALQAEGIPIDQISGAGDVTPAGAAFVNARRATSHKNDEARPAPRSVPPIAEPGPAGEKAKSNPVSNTRADDRFQAADTKQTPGADDASPDAADVRDTEPSDADEAAIWADRRFRAAAKALGDPHRDSPVAAEMMRGWSDGQAATTAHLDVHMDQIKGSIADVAGRGQYRFNPVNPYLEGFYAAVTGDPIEIRLVKTTKAAGTPGTVRELRRRLSNTHDIPLYSHPTYAIAPGDNFASEDALRQHLLDGALGEAIRPLLEAGRIVLHDNVGSSGVAPGSRAGSLDQSSPTGEPGADVAISKAGREGNNVGEIQGLTTPDGRIHLNADQLTSRTAVPVLLHEMFHAGVRPLVGERAWTATIARLDALFRAAAARAVVEGPENSDFWRDALDRVDAAQVPDSQRAEEFAAYAVEQQAQAPRGVRAIVDALIGQIKAWALRRFGRQLGVITPAQLHALAVAALRSQAVAPRADAARSARPIPDDEVAEILTQLGQVDELFRYPVSDKAALPDIVAEIDPTLRPVAVISNETLDKDGPFAVTFEEMQPADRVHVYETAQGRRIFIAETNDDVWLDVSRLAEGQGGSAIYAAVADYAFNTGRTFIGDPNGLSDIALRRRTDAMLSSAIKHGSTDHLAPHQRQLEGDAALGVPPLRWKKGDYYGNVRNLIGVSVDALAHQYPAVKRARYDFQSATFRTGAGKPLSDELLARWGVSARRAGATGAGRATLRRGILLHSLVRASGGEKSQLLARVLREPVQLVSPALRGVFYSRRGPSVADIDAATPGVFHRALTNAMNGDMSILGSIPHDILAGEMAVEDHDLTAITDYLDLKNEMDATRGKWHAQIALVTKKWTKFKARKIGSGQNKALMDLMHESTLAGVDPSRDFMSVITPTDRAALKAGPDDAGFDDARDRQHEDRQRKEDHVRLTEAWKALPKAAQDLYVEVRDSYRAMSDAFEQALLDNLSKALDIRHRQVKADYDAELIRIADSDLNDDARDAAFKEAERVYNRESRVQRYAKGARMTRLRAFFETRNIAGPYFPLARFGAYFVAVRDKGTGEKLAFSRFETEEEQATFAAAMRKEGHDVDHGVLGDGDGMKKLRDQVDPQFVVDIETILQGADITDTIRDAVWQRWLETLPDMSLRKSRIHRKGTAGFSTDALRAFANHMFHGSHQLARLQYALDMDDALNRAETQAARADDPNRAKLEVIEMRRRHIFTMNPTGAPWSHTATSMAFVWFLAWRPSAALANLGQTAIMGIPFLAAYDGHFRSVGRASYELTRALKDFAGGAGFAERSSALTSEEKQAMRAAYDSGVADRTQSHDLAGLSETGVKYRPVPAMAMEVVSWSFHHTERLNREITYLAAYRMARTKGESHDRAITDASRLTRSIHFNYTNTARPRFMQGNVAKVAFVFKNFLVNMIGRLVRDTYQSFKGRSPAARKQARIQLIGVTGMMMLSAGITGTWGYGIVMAVARAIAALMGSDDDPEQEFKKGLKAVLGERLGSQEWGDAIGTAALEGVPGAALGVSLSERIGMPDLWFRSPDRQLEGRAGFEYWALQTMGATVAMGGNLWAGAEMAANGNKWRGIETAAPNGIKDLMRTYRYAREGARTLKGDSVKEDFTTLELFHQALGFTPNDLARQYEINSAATNKQQRIKDRRQQILTDYDDAVRADRDTGDIEARIDAFNDAHPSVMIMPKTLHKSMRAKERRRQEMRNGVYIDPKLADELGVADNDVDEEDEEKVAD